MGLLFPGQGSQKVGMGKDIYEMSRAARWVYDEASRIMNRDIKKISFDGPEEELTSTANSQPAIFVNSIALLNVLIEKVKHSPVGDENRGIFSKDDVKLIGGLAMGLSLGEPTSLVASGAMTFEQGITFVMRRGQYMEEASNKQEGKMASIIGLDMVKIEEICKGVGCQIANLNCPGQVVISGAAGKVELAAELCKNAGAKRAIMLKVSGAFHSDLMLPAKEKLKKVLDEITVNEPAIDFISNIDAKLAKDPVRIKDNLANQLDNRTLWESSIIESSSKGFKDYLEIGPGNVLKGLVKKIDPALNVTSIETLQDIDNFVSCP